MVLFDLSIFHDNYFLMASLQASWFSSFSSVSHSSPKKGHTFTPFRVNFSLNSSNEDSSPPEAGSETEKAPIDPVKLAFSKAKEYKKSAQSRPKSESQKSPAQDSSTESKKRVPDSVRIAMEKAKEYAKNKGNLGSEKISGLNRASPENSGDGTLEKKAEKKMKKKEGFSISSIDFVGLNFADKKTGRDIPAGLVPISDPFPEEGDVPEVEIIVGNANEFTRGKSPNPEKAQENEPDVYRPKVSTWGVFPRPSNISKTFGGGKTLKPGEALETEEERAAKDANTRKVITAYKKKTGIFIDPKKKTECEEVLKNGDLLMDRGKLKEASSYYEKVMSDLPFQSELHGLAALQWSICQDSLTRSKEARDMYEKLRSHPSPRVSKKARQFMFSFQAMEMMKVTLRSPDSVKNEEYENFFEAFVEKKSEYSSNEVDEDQVLSLNKTLPYILLLVSPIFIVLFAALKKRI